MRDINKPMNIPVYATMEQRLAALRVWMRIHDLDAFILPVTDEYQGEYPADYAKRVRWLCGFDGSAGVVVVLPQHAALLTDGRYTLQAAQQLDAALYSVHNLAELSVVQYLASHLPEDAEHSRIGIDGWLHSIQQRATLESALDKHNVGKHNMRLQVYADNPIDALWHDQPTPPAEPVLDYALQYAGVSRASKCKAMAEQLMQMGVSHHMITEPDALCWLLNIRGRDVPYNPLMLGMAVVHADASVDVFMSEPAGDALQKIIQQDAEALCVRIHTRAALLPYVQTLHKSDDATLSVDAATCPAIIADVLTQADIKSNSITSPLHLAKAQKNNAELMGMRKAHLWEAVAYVRLLHWLDVMPADATIIEQCVVQKLEELRKQCPDYIMPSFATIAGAGEHGAIIHYHPPLEHSRTLAHGEVLLLDAGGQYGAGTTDATRTIVRGLGAGAVLPDNAFLRAYTNVLKGHIALAMAVFPDGTEGAHLDVLARQYLWAEHKDYAHGTGHGVGAHLCVHEGPCRISRRFGSANLLPGMILSNEPGYYVQGHYGIRLENLVEVVQSPQLGWMHFENLTLLPFDRRLTITDMLSAPMQAWLDAYQTHVYNQLQAHVPPDVALWLKKQ